MSHIRRERERVKFIWKIDSELVLSFISISFCRCAVPFHILVCAHVFFLICSSLVSIWCSCCCCCRRRRRLSSFSFVNLFVKNGALIASKYNGCSFLLYKRFAAHRHTASRVMVMVNKTQRSALIKQIHIEDEKKV